MPLKIPPAERPTIEQSKSAIARQNIVMRKANDPDFDSMFEDDGENPMGDLDLIDDLHADADAGMSEALRQIIERKRATQERFRTATDPEFFFCVCFQSREQKEQFLELVGWSDLGDKYINGLEVARRLKVPIEIIPIEPLKIRGKVKKFEKADII